METRLELVVGTEGYLVDNIVRILKECSSAEVVFRSWKEVARALSEEATTILQIERRLMTYDIDHSGVYHELLLRWKSRKGKEATVDSLINALQQCSLNDCADSINAILNPPSVRAMRVIRDMVRSNALWRKLGERRGWIRHFNSATGPNPTSLEEGYYQSLHSDILQDIQSLEACWLSGDPSIKIIECDPELNSTVINCLQYDDSKIVAGLGNGAVKVWDRSTFNCDQVLQHNTSAVCCLQFDESVIISGHDDGTILVANLSSGEILATLTHHTRQVRSLQINRRMLLTCSEWDWTIAVWDMKSHQNIKLQKQLAGHSGDVMDVALDDKYIISASFDKTIKVWNTASCQLAKTLEGHAQFVNCIDYRDGTVVSGSDDKTIRIWNVERGTCERVLDCVIPITCVRFDSKRIISGDWNGEIKIYDMESKRNSESFSLACKRTLRKHSGVVRGIQFDDFQVVSCSTDGRIIVWTFDTTTN